MGFGATEIPYLWYSLQARWRESPVLSFSSSLIFAGVVVYLFTRQRNAQKVLQYLKVSVLDSH